MNPSGENPKNDPYQPYGTFTPEPDDGLTYVKKPKITSEKTPITLIIGAIIVLILLIVVVVFHSSGLSGAKIADLGQPLESYKDEAIVEASPLNDKDLSDIVGPQSDPISKPTKAQSSFAASQDTTIPTIRDVPIDPTIQPNVPDLPQTDKPATENKEQVSEKKPSLGVTSSAVSKTSSSKTADVVAQKNAASGAFTVQIGAFGSNEIAQAQFSKMKQTYSAQTVGTVKRIDVVKIDGATYYRTSFSGFETKEKARAFCNLLKNSGKDCLVR